ncbi:MAG: SCO2322 family protein [Acidothermaceae bacterium]
MTKGRRFASTALAVLAIVAIAGSLVGIGSGTAQAATAYRYWAFYVASGSNWQYSQRGPAFEHPVDGEVQGWRFAVQAEAAGNLAPRTTPDFAKLCASTPAKQGDLRVGIVLDFGLASDAPTGEKPRAQVVSGCVQVASGSTGVDVLDAAVGASNVRIGNGLICGIDGYPKTECAAAVSAPIATASPATAPTKSAATPAKSPAPKPPTVTPTPMPTATPASTAETIRSSQPLAAPASAAAAAVPTTASALSSAGPAASSLPLTSLNTAHKSSGFPAGTVIGAILVVALALGAALKTLAGRR